MQPLDLQPNGRVRDGKLDGFDGRVLDELAAVEQFAVDSDDDVTRLQLGGGRSCWVHLDDHIWVVVERVARLVQTEAEPTAGRLTFDEHLFLLDATRFAGPPRVELLDAFEAEGLFYGKVHLRSDPATCGGGKGLRGKCGCGGGAERVGSRGSAEKAGTRGAPMLWVWLG